MSSGYGPPPPIQQAPSGVPVAFASSAPQEANFSPSPWARAAPVAAPAGPVGGQAPAAPMGAPQQAPQAPPGGFGGMAAGAMGAVPQPAAVGFGSPPPMMPSSAGGVAAPPPMMPGRAPPMAPGGIAPPPVFTPPPMMSPGVLSGPPPVGSPIGTQGRVLVGFLVTFQNDPAGSFWAIHSGRTQLGRSASEGVDIALQDASASSRHASVHADSATGQAFVEDDSSRNGTFLNEQRLSPGDRRQLRDNDRLRLGSTTFVVKLLVS